VVQNVTNAPNPFRPRTTIHFDLVESCPVTVQVFDYRGRLVRTLLTDAYRNAGTQEVPWDGNDEDARRVSSGVYFYRIATETETVSRKMVVLP
jgi:flagellar hook assembly protein FlgD